jgi:PAS domain S-box-containing protein
MDGRWVGELMIMDDKGASFPVLFSSSIVKDKDGEAIAIIAIIRDLTQSKAMIEALSDSENRFRKIFEDGPIAMAFSDYNNGKFIKVNKSFHDMLQYSELELFNMTFKDITYPDDLENNIENINKLRTKEISIYKTEKRYIKKNKDIMRGLLTLSVTYDNLGEPEYFLPMIEDITERKEADELKQRHLQVQAIINTILELSLKPMTMSSLLDGILGIILSIHWLALQSKGCILLVEDDFEKLKLVAQRNLHINLLNHCAIVPFGYCLCGKAAATKKIIFTDKIDQDHDHHYEGMTEHGHYIIPILSGDTVLGVLNLYVKEGHKWEQWEENFLISVANTMAGIIDRKHIEDQLRHYSEELNKSNEELKTFTYIVSHDLRAPLVNLKGFSYELKESVNEILPLLSQFKESIDPVQYERYRCAFEEDIPESLNFIEASSTKIDHMMNAILKLSRLGRSQLEMEQIDVNELVHFTINSLSHQIETKGVEITCGKLPKITGDRVSIEQIFGNLLDNALKYLDPNRKGKIKITGEIKGASAVFHFKDNGIGIAEGDFDKVFAIFRRIGISKEPGEGMGLAYTKALITKHNGNIWCESTLGKGTTFSFTIPL